MWQNPIIKKELLSVLRSRGAVVLAVVYVVVLSGLALALWPREGINPLASMESRLLLTVVGTSQLLMLALFSVPFAATAVCVERETGTYELLHYTLLGPMRIVVGKMVGAVGFLLMLLILSLPVGSVCFLLGGVSLMEMGRLYLVLVVSGVVFALIGLAFSSIFSRSFPAIVGTYIALMVLCGGVHVPMLLLPSWGPGQKIFHAVRCASPFTALVASTRDVFAQMGPTASLEAVERFFVYAMVMVVLLLGVIIAMVARRPAPRPMRRKRVADEMPLGLRILRRLFFIIDPRRRKRSIGDLMNPIIVLELRTRTAGLANLIRACFVCVAFSIGMVLLVSGTWGEPNVDVIRLIAIGFQLGLIGLIGPSLTAGALSSEVEAQRLDLLRMAPLRSHTIIFGKLGAAFIFSLMLVIASAPVFFAILYIIEKFEVRYFISMFSVTIGLIVATVSSGLFFSTICRRTAAATAWAYGVVALIFVGSLAALVLRERLSDTAANVILGMNPVITVVSTVSDDLFIEYDLWHINLIWLSALSAIFLIGSLYRLHRLAGPMG